MGRLRRIVKRASVGIVPLLDDLLNHTFRFAAKRMEAAASSVQLSQMLLLRHYERIRAGELPPLGLRDVEYRAYSQNGEDGILLYIFGLIGMGQRKVVELCAGDGLECNAANLIINHGWSGLLVDGDPLNIRRGKAFYSRCRDTRTWPPHLVQSWVTAENVNSTLAENGFGGEIDLLSLDLDGMEYWIWRALSVTQPRVVVVEYNDVLGPNRSVTVPYHPGFRASFGAYGPDYAGASLPALVKLAREKGYRLIGCQSREFNAFFVRAGLGEGLLPEVEARECFVHPEADSVRRLRLPNLEGREWVEV